MSSIVIVDTSVLLNIIDVPDRNQRKEEVLDRLATLIESSDHLFIPMAAIVEVGNHIAHGRNGAQRRAAAGRFVKDDCRPLGIDQENHSTSSASAIAEIAFDIHAPALFGPAQSSVAEHPWAWRRVLRVRVAASLLAVLVLPMSV